MQGSTMHHAGGDEGVGAFTLKDRRLAGGVSARRPPGYVEAGRTRVGMRRVVRLCVVGVVESMNVCSVRVNRSGSST